MTMTHKQAILAAVKRETVDILPFVPRIDMWYNANSQADTLPAEHKGKTRDQISLAEGWPLYNVLADFRDLRSPDDMVHRGIGVITTRHFPYTWEFNDQVEFTVTNEGDATTVIYNTPLGSVRTVFKFTEELRKAGSTIPFISEHVIKGPEDYKILAHVFQNLTIKPDYEDFDAWVAQTGENGLCCATAHPAASPMHAIQRDMLNPTEFYFHYNDHAAEMRMLAEAMEPYFQQILDVTAGSSGQGVQWGANFDDMITYAPFFEKEIMPWMDRACRTLHDKNKFVYSHCDGENLGLMDLIRDSGIDLAEAVCPWPMTKVPVEEYYSRWSGNMAIMGGVPSNIMLAEMASDEEFEAYIDHLLKAIAPGTGFVVGIADTTPPAANIDRIRRLADRIRTEGVLPLKAGSFDPISPERMAQTAQAAAPLAAGGDLETIQQDVFKGNQDGIGAHIQTLLDQGVEGRYILDHGLIAAMEIIGPKFKAGELFIPEVLLSARAMNQGLTVLEPHLTSAQKEGGGRILIGSVKGDLHDIGKNMVTTMLKGVGFEVIDLGIDVSTEQFLSAIKEHKPHIVGLSSLLTTTMPAMQLVIDALTEAGLRNQVKVIVGGAPVNQNYADQIGADGYAEDASVAVEIAKKLTKA